MPTPNAPKAPKAPPTPTPGPWHSHVALASDSQVIDGGDRMPVAYSVGSGRDPAVAVANARLIAAAPALMEKGQALVDALNVWAASCPSAVAEAIHELRSALAAASAEGPGE